MNISVNIRRDLLVVNMCIYLLSERGHKDTVNNDILLKLSNKSHKQNKKIDIICNNLVDKLKNTISDTHRMASNREVVVKWCDTFWNSAEVGRLFSSIRETNMELLAQQILYVNFIDRKFPVFQTMEWLRDEEIHEDLFNLLIKTNAESILEKVYSDAVRCVEVLKGKS